MITLLSHIAHRPVSLLGKWITHLSDLFDHLIKTPPLKPLPVMSRRQKLAAAVDAAKQIKRGMRR